MATAERWRQVLMRKGRAAIAALVILLLAWSEPVAACGCAALTLAEEAAAASAIFIGKVTKLQVTDVEEGVSQIEVTIERERVFKGSVATTVVFKTSDGCCYCAPWFDIARRYLIFAHERQGELVTNSCTRTKLIEKAKEEIQYLEQASFVASAPN